MNLRLGFLLLFCCGVQAASAFEGQLVAEIGGDGPVVYSVKGDLIRIEAGGDEPLIALRDLRQSSVRMLMPEEKSYVDVPLRDMSPYVEAGDAKVTKTGEKRTIHGYACEKWVVTEGDGRSELWVTDQLGVDFAALWLPTMSMQTSWSSALGRNFPLKMSSADENGRMETFWEITAIQKKRIDDAQFAVPAGYRKMQM